MTKNNKDALHNIKHMAKQGFEKINPKHLQTLLNHPEKLDGYIQTKLRTEELHQTHIKHLAHMKPLWVQKEVTKIWMEHLQNNNNHPKPNWVNDNPNASLREEAHRRVSLRIQSRKTQYNNIQTRILGRTLFAPTPKLNIKDQAVTLKKDVQKIISRTKSIRQQAESHFKKHQSQWHEKAIRQDTRNPDIDISKRQHERLARIDRAGMALIEQAHGHTRDQNRQPDLSYDFSMSGR